MEKPNYTNPVERRMKQKQTRKAHFIINATLAAQESCEDPFDYAKETIKETLTQLAIGTSFQLTPLGVLESRDMAYGPFETRTKANFIIPSELNEKGLDWQGNKWFIGEVPMIWDDYMQPNYGIKRVYRCAECENIQMFKGSCSKCKGEGRLHIKTMEIKDWGEDF